MGGTLNSIYKGEWDNQRLWLVYDLIYWKRSRIIFLSQFFSETSTAKRLMTWT